MSTAPVSPWAAAWRPASRCISSCCCRPLPRRRRRRSRRPGRSPCSPDLITPFRASGRSIGGGAGAGGALGAGLSRHRRSRRYPARRAARRRSASMAIGVPGAAKGAVYGGVFVALLLSVQTFVAEPGAVSLFLASGYIGAAIAGAALFPLARTILESTDSTPPFVGRSKQQYLEPTNFVSGAVVGAASCWLSPTVCRRRRVWSASCSALPSARWPMSARSCLATSATWRRPAQAAALLASLCAGRVARRRGRRRGRLVFRSRTA